MSVTDEDRRHLRAAIAEAFAAKARGDQPYGGVLVAASGEVLATAGATVTTGNDFAAHGEMNALRAARRDHGMESLRGATMYASGEPCPMCAGAMYWAGISRVVYGLDGPVISRITGLPADAGRLSCRAAFAAGPRPTIVEGPTLTDEAAAVFRS